MMNRRSGPAIMFLVLLLSLASCSDDSTGPGEDNGDKDSYCDMQPLPAPTGTLITVSSASELYDAVNAANTMGNLTILLEDGTYDLTAPLYVAADNITIRSISGNRDNVIVSGDGIDGTLDAAFVLNGDNLTIADLTLGWSAGNGILVFNDADDCLLHNLRIVDTGLHMIKVSPADTPGPLTERGELRWCLLEYTSGIGPASYIGGILAAESADWIVHHNIIRGIRSPEAEIAGPAVMFWDDSANTIIEHNNIYNCDRGIMLGLLGGEASQMGGMIRNNMIHTNRDVGIGLQGAESVSIYNNTVYTENYYVSIEYRWESTRFTSIINNLTSASIIPRDGGTGVLETNVMNAEASWFIDPTGGDLRLAASQATVVDQGTELTAVPIDFECDKRPKGDATDIGADEY